MLDEIQIATSEDGVTRVLVAVPQACGVCGEPRTLFISRSGNSRCYECDEGFRRAEAVMRRELLGLPCA